MPFYTYQQLVNTKSEDAIFSESLGVLQSNGFPVTTWRSGDISHTLVRVDSRIVYGLESQIATIGSNVFRSTAQGQWLDSHGSSFYNLDRILATSTKGMVKIYDSSGTGPHNIGAGELWVTTANGELRFNNINTFVVPLNGSASVEVIAEEQGSGYNVVANSIEVVASGQTGISVLNEEITTGAVLAQYSGIGTDNATLMLRFTNTGTLGTDALNYVYSIDGGNSFPFTGTIAAGNYTLTIFGITYYFYGKVTSQDYLVSDIFAGVEAQNTYFLTYGLSSSTWITQAGRDEETDLAYADRMGAQWASLAYPAPNGYFESLIKSRVPTITRVKERPHRQFGFDSGNCMIVVAGPAGSVSASEMQAAYDVCQLHRPVCCRIVMVNATINTVTIQGDVYVDSQFLTTAQAEILASLTSLGSEIDFGGTLYIAEIVQRVMDATGVYNYVPIYPNGDIVIPENEAINIALNLTWHAT